MPPPADDHLVRRLRELQERVARLQEENERLAERQADATLLGYLAEHLETEAEPTGIFRAGLERISVLKDVPVCLVVERFTDRLAVVQAHHAGSHERLEGRDLRVPPGLLAELELGSVWLEGAACASAGLTPEVLCGLTAGAALVIPCMCRMLPRGAFVFVAEAPGRGLAEASQILHRACEAIVSRVENVTLMDELILVNAALDRRVAERTQELAASEARLRLALSAAEMATFQWSPTEDRLSWSEGAETLLGGQPATLAGYLELVAGDDAAAVAAALREAPLLGKRILVAHRLAERRDLWLELHASSAGGTVTGVIVDVTERRRLEEDLRQAQRLDSIGRLAGGVAHDFNNLLTTILGVGELLAAELPAGSRAAEDMSGILEAGRHAATLTRQLLAFARRQRLETTSVDLGQVVQAFTPMLRRLIGEDVAVELALDPRAPPVLADRPQLEQVLMNLAVNARDAMPGGGTLAIAVGPADPPSGAPRDGPARWCRLSVRDTGPGMAPEVMANAFEPFFTTKQPGHGTGLGLATVYGIVRQHGGDVRLGPAPGSGLVVEVLLPEAPRPPEPAEASRGRQPLPGGRETVLVVDDEPTVRRVLEVILSRLGYRVLSAAGAVEALGLAEEHGPVDLLLTDLVMPGMRGTELARRFQERHPRAAVLLMSGYPGNEPLDPGLRLVSKPLTPEVLAAAAREALDARR